MPSAVERSDAPLARWRRRRGRLAALALTAVLVLLTAPLRAALRIGCDLCPSDCPMHATTRAADPDNGARAPAMRCHNTVDAHQEGAPERGPRLTRPPCGSPAAVVGPELAPMLTTAPLPSRVAPQVARGACQ